jgi:S1/P1 Nuclease
VLKSPDAPRNEKRIALRFVAHLVGDIHQPLHAGFADDRGGNSVDVRFNGRKENLHSLWDTALVELEQGTPRHSGRLIAGDSQGAGASAICVGRDHRKLRRIGTRCNSDSLSAGWRKARGTP